MSSKSTDDLSSDQEIPPVKRAFARGGIVPGGGDPTSIPALLDNGCVFPFPRGAKYEGTTLMEMQLLLDDHPIPGVPAVPEGPQTISDPVNHPKHYTSHPSGVECITITRWHNFNIGNAVKYLWRTGLKDDTKQIEDLEKAVFYIKDEVERLKGLQ